MSRIRSKNTSPELTFENWLISNGIPYVKHLPIPGSPDFLIPFVSLAIFVHGCFWHGCGRHFKSPKTNKKFWTAKIDNNRKRDRKNTRILRGLGFETFNLWEHDIKSFL